MKKLLLFALIIICNSAIAQECPSPGIYGVANITQNSAYLQWIAGTPSDQWEILVVASTSPPPTEDVVGYVTTAVNPYVITGLNCNTKYRFYVRNICGPDSKSLWSQPGFFITNACTDILPDIEVCDDGTGSAVAELGIVNSHIAAFLDSGNEEVTYHPTAADAANEVNLIETPYTISTPTVLLFARSENIVTGEFVVYPFNVNIVQAPNIPDQMPVEVCSNNGTAAFDLRQIAQNLYASYPAEMQNAYVTFHEELMDAEYGWSQINGFYTNEVPEFQMLYMRIVNGFTGCFIVKPLHLSVPPCSGFEFMAFIDENGNGTYEVGEPPFTHGSLNLYDNNAGTTEIITSSDGIFSTLQGSIFQSYNASIVIDPEFSDYFSSPVSMTGLFPTISPTVQYFPITVLETFKDVSIAVIPFDQPRPGFAYSEVIVIENNGPTDFNGTLTFFHDPAVSITSTSASVTDITGGFAITMTDFSGFETMYITVVMQVPTIPTVTLGNLLVNSAAVISDESEINIENNSASSSQVIVGSYDPNDKIESRGSQILIDDFTSDDYLTYTIRFENTGTASALNVRVTDELDSWLNPETVRAISASHDYMLQRTGNTLTWTFNDIMLPFISDDPIGSHGFIQFQVKPNAGVTEGIEIPNTASIYFDFNPPIITNTFVTEFVDFMGIGENSNDDFIMYPNPADQVLHIESVLDVKSITMIDITGKTIFDLHSADFSRPIDVSAINAGMYFLHIESLTGEKSVKKILIK